MYDDSGAQLKRKFFKKTDTGYLMNRCKMLEKYNAELFQIFIRSGITMVDAAVAGDVESLKKEFAKAVDKEIMYWHVTKALKEAIKH